MTDKERIKQATIEALLADVIDLVSQSKIHVMLGKEMNMAYLEELDRRFMEYKKIIKETT